MSGATPRPSVVVVGGGHGCSRSLEALARLDVDRTAIVTVADDGGSSGRLRRDHDVVALGDLRMAMLAMAQAAETTTPSATIARLARRRFSRGELAGHSLGNLLLLGLLEDSGGDLVAALEELGQLLGADGRVLPVTTQPVTLFAETASGTVAGQVAVASTRRIDRVRLDPEDPPLARGVRAAIEGADVILLGPGSLYTSIIPVLLVRGLADALTRTSARIVLIGNLREQPGETEGMTLAEHVEALHAHVPELRIDAVIAHERRPGARETTGVRDPLPLDAPRLGRLISTVVRHDLGDELDGHDPSELARAIEAFVVGGGRSPDAGQAAGPA